MEHQPAEFFSSLFQEHSVPMWIVAKEDYIIQDVNEAALALFNSKREVFLHTSFKHIFPTDFAKMEGLFAQKSSGYCKLQGLNHTLPDGQPLVVEVNFKETVYNGLASYFFKATTKKCDYESPGKHVANFGRNQEELSDVIINSLPGVFYLFDENGKFLRWNKNFEIVTGYSGDDIENMIPLDFFQGADKDVIFERISAVFVNGKAEARACFHTKYNTCIPYHFNGNLIEYMGKRCLIGMGIDVTPQKAAERDREELLTRLEKLSDNIPGFIYEYCVRKNGSSFFPFTSKGIEDIYGLTSDDVKEDSTPLLSCIHPDDLETVSDALGLSKTATTNSTEFRIHTKLGKTKWVKTNAAVEPQPDGSTMYYGYTEDITSVKQAEYELIKTNRLISFTSHFHEMVIHAKTEEECLREACRIAVVHGGFRMAWIGCIDSVTNMVVPNASYGYLNNFFRVIKTFSLDDTAAGSGPSCTAAKHGMMFINNDIADPENEGYEVWAHDALVRGYRSCIEIPIVVRDEIIGVFNLYHEEPFFFTEKEIKTIEEVIAEIQFGLTSLGIAADREKKITEQHNTQEQLDQKRRMIEAVSEIQAKFIEERKPAAYFDFALDKILTLTGSEYGFIGEIVDDAAVRASLKFHADVSCDSAKSDVNLHKLFDEVIATRKMLISNDLRHNINGEHSKFTNSGLRCFLGLPILNGEDLVGMIGLANRPGGYSSSLADDLSPIIYTIRGILQAFRTEALAKQVSENLRDTLSHLELAHQVSGLGVWKLDFRQRKLAGDDRCANIFGISQREIKIEEYWNLIHPEERKAKMERDQMAINSSETDYFSEYRIVRPKDGQVRYIKSQGLFFRDENGKAVSGLSVIYDQSREKQFEKSLLNSVEEKEMLIKEIHHRVKNNLQLISSMLYLKTLAWNNSEANEFMSAMREKIKSVSLIHERLLQTNNLNSIDIQEYLEKLLHDIEVTYHRHDLQLAILSRIEELHFTSDHATSVGQIVNELVINAIKHGFKDKQQGKIVVSLRKYDSFYELVVEDDGHGFSSEIDPVTSTTFGMQLIQIFAKQINGSLDVVTQPTTRFKITFREIVL